jgi:hypothetical protein
LDKSLYFYRTAIYTENNGEPALADINNPTRITPLEPWFGVVVPLADGQHTLGELIECIAYRYQGNAPANLEQTLESVVERLIEGKLLVTSTEKAELPYYLAQPIEHLDIEKAKNLMAEDGLTLQ